MKNSLKNGCKVALKTVTRDKPPKFANKILVIKMIFYGVGVWPSSLAQWNNSRLRRNVLNFESSPRVNFNERISSSTDWKFAYKYSRIFSKRYSPLLWLLWNWRFSVFITRFVDSSNLKKLVVEREAPLHIMTRWRTVWNETNFINLSWIWIKN